MKRMSIILATIAVLTLGTVSYASLDKRPATAPSTQATAQVLAAPTEQELLDAVNAERAKVGVAPLTLDSRVSRSAQLKANDMQANNYTAHIMPSTGKVLNDEMKALLVDACADSSENIHWATSSARTVTGAINGWMNSKPHHDAILDPKYSTTGFGVAWGEKMIIVEHFCIAK